MPKLSIWYATSTYRYAGTEKPIFVDVIEIEEPPPVGIDGEQVEVMMVIPLRPQMTWRNPPRIIDILVLHC